MGACRAAHGGNSPLRGRYLDVGCGSGAALAVAQALGWRTAGIEMVPGKAGGSSGAGTRQSRARTCGVYRRSFAHACEVDRVAAGLRCVEARAGGVAPARAPGTAGRSDQGWRRPESPDVAKAEGESSPAARLASCRSRSARRFARRSRSSRSDFVADAMCSARRRSRSARCRVSRVSVGTLPMAATRRSKSGAQRRSLSRRELPTPESRTLTPPTFELGQADTPEPSLSRVLESAGNADLRIRVPRLSQAGQPPRASALGGGFPDVSPLRRLGALPPDVALCDGEVGRNPARRPH